MNKPELLSSINLNIPVIAAFARLELLGEIQNFFDLHPGKLAKDLKRISADRKEPASFVAHYLLPQVIEAFRFQFNQARCRLSTVPTEPSSTEFASATVRFGLDPDRIAKAIRDRIKECGMDPMELVIPGSTLGELTATVLLGIVQKTIEWSFGEAVAIASKKQE